MKRLIAIALLSLTAFLLCGCSPLQAQFAELQQKYDALASENAVLQAENESLAQQLDALSTPAPQSSPTAAATLAAADFPIKISRLIVVPNLIGTHELCVIIENNGDRPVDAFDFTVRCFDAYGELVHGYAMEPGFDGSYTGGGGSIEPGKTSPNTWYWTLFGFDTATRFEVALTGCHETDGNTYALDERQLEFVAVAAE